MEQTPPPPAVAAEASGSPVASPFVATLDVRQQAQAAAATPLTPLAGPALPQPSPLRRRGYFTDVHGGGAFSRVPSLFGRLEGDRSRPLTGGAVLPTVGTAFGRAALNLSWPEGGEVSAECRDLVERLLQLEPKQRLGHRGAGEVKLHPWFAGVDWASLARQKVAFVPQPDCDTDTSYFSSKPVSQRSLALDLDSSRGELDLAAVTAAVGAAAAAAGAGAPLSPAASLASSRSQSRGGSRRPSARRRSLRQALAEPSGASLSELRGLRGATLSHSSGASAASAASLAGGDAMAVDASGGSVVRAAADLLRQQSTAGQQAQAQAQAHAWLRHAAQQPSRSATVLSGGSELPEGEPRGPLSADDEELASPSEAAAATEDGGEAASACMGRYGGAASPSASSCGSPMGSDGGGYSSGGEGGGSEASSEASGSHPHFRNFSFKNLDMLAEQNLQALRDQYEEEFSEFDRPPDLNALRSLTPSPERPPPPT
ncbi:hypothetical protein CHLNCDRAFT_58089 [Chlorella variabilis]|uniref:non-specific serine/threonine protein kinase n=1 Tax=Chlorella variabilis TaxID=554065 RepID=E1ZH36_CHLVA|nr:hypothetical protein CHLNCDRAFT_58089 [Chlorella variabilis]EFN55050.1 hypothetical protein CHLNCDRAFT_58089 [Chlorella variabilis]|eukprot:XP_005847152.1 hypothetical protein CHLNCDRAFT_58089 [Chlorella variabilis]